MSRAIKVGYIKSGPLKRGITTWQKRAEVRTRKRDKSVIFGDQLAVALIKRGLS